MCVLSGVGVIFSRTSHASSIPAVSRSLMEIVPLGLSAETRFCCISFGHCSRHTVGWMDDVPGVQTPPTAVPDESTNPM